jgi:hypothetical protein
MCPLSSECQVRLIEVREEEQGMKFFMKKVHYYSFFGSFTMAVSVVGFGVLCFGTSLFMTFCLKCLVIVPEPTSERKC